MGLEQNNEQHYREVVDKYHAPLASYPMTTRDYVMRPDAAAGAMTLTLPPVADAKGRWYSIIAEYADNTNTITITHKSDSEVWSGDVVLNEKGRGVMFYSDGMKWASEPWGDIHFTSSLVAGNINLREIHLTLDTIGTGAVNVEALRVEITSTVKSGAWVNAIVGKIDFSTTGAAHGMAAAICADMVPPNSSLVRGSLYCMDFAIGPGAASSWGSAGPVAFMNFQCYGTNTYLDDNGYWFRFDNIDEGVGHILSLNAHTIRVLVDGLVPGKERYVVLSTTENSLTMVVNHTAVAERALNITTTQTAITGTHIANRFQLTPATGTDCNSYTMNIRNTVEGVIGYQRALYIETEIGAAGDVDAMHPIYIETWTSNSAVVAGECAGIYIAHYLDVTPAGAYDGIRIDHGGAGVMDGFVNFRGAATSCIHGNAPVTNFLLAEATGQMGCTIAANGMTADPENGQEAGYITISVQANSYQIPFYTA